MPETTSAADEHAAGEADGVASAEFQGLRGHLLVEAIFQKYGAGIMTIPWLNEAQGGVHSGGDGRAVPVEIRNIKRDPVNRPVMESVAEAYCDRILHSGLNVDCAGVVWIYNNHCN